MTRRPRPAVLGAIVLGLLVVSADIGVAQESAPDGDVAMLLSLAGTAAPLAAGVATSSEGLFLAGMLVGPTVGYFYGGVSDVGLRGMLLRTAVLGGSILAAIAICGDCSIFDDDASTTGAFLILTAGFLATAILDLRDIFRVSGVVERRHAAQVSLGLVPIEGAGVGLGFKISH